MDIFEFMSNLQTTDNKLNVNELCLIKTYLENENSQESQVIYNFSCIDMIYKYDLNNDSALNAKETIPFLIQQFNISDDLFQSTDNNNRALQIDCTNCFPAFDI